MRFDPTMLVRRHGLRGELPADPIGFFRHHDPQAVAKRRDRRRATAQTPADNHQVRPDLAARSLGDSRHGQRSLLPRKQPCGGEPTERRQKTAPMNCHGNLDVPEKTASNHSGPLPREFGYRQN
jgi:hypothetical protein